MNGNKKQLELDIRTALSWFQYIPVMDLHNEDVKAFKRLYAEYADES